MNGDEERPTPGSAGEPLGPGAEESSDELRQLLRGGLPDTNEPPDVLRGVQKKLRERSRGKFYADRWSTDKNPPIATYLVTSAIMLAVTFVIYALLSPLVGDPEPVHNAPAPVRVLPPR
jgi:hypothetical protein